jgi:hypothetical protein
MQGTQQDYRAAETANDFVEKKRVMTSDYRMTKDYEPFVGPHASGVVKSWQSMLVAVECGSPSQILKLYHWPLMNAWCYLTHHFIIMGELGRSGKAFVTAPMSAR